MKIYALRDPETDKVRYVGATRHELSRRLVEHLLPSVLKFKTPRTTWLKGLLAKGMKPVIELLTECSDGKWEEAEQFWIRSLTGLTNSTPGGIGIQEFNDSVRKKIGKANSKVIYQYNMTGEFIREWPSARQAARFLRTTTPSVIIAAANPGNRKKSAGGYQWSRVFKGSLPAYRGRVSLSVLMNRTSKTTLSNMNKLSFLNKVVIKNDKAVSSKSAGSKRPAEGADLRIYHTGAIFPSEELVKLFNLEYQKADSKDQGNGFDVFEGKRYGGFDSQENFILIAAIPRNKNRRGADVFKSCSLNEDGSPKASVLDQGVTTFGEQVLIPMLEDVYDIKLDKDAKPFVDLKIVGHGDEYSMPYMNTNGSEVYHIPKRIAAGDAKGQSTTVRREHLLIWALVPFEWVTELENPIVLSGPVYKDIPDVQPSAEEAALNLSFTPGGENGEEEVEEPDTSGEPETDPGYGMGSDEPEVEVMEPEEPEAPAPPPPPVPKPTASRLKK